MPKNQVCKKSGMLKKRYAKKPVWLLDTWAWAHGPGRMGRPAAAGPAPPTPPHPNLPQRRRPGGGRPAGRRPAGGPAYRIFSIPDF